jgi:metal-responsive CopG/Arc/MetJ family transcriptional regulator
VRGRKRTAKAEGGGSVRASISFPSDVYKELDDIAREKRVSLAWVVRDAAEKYLAERWPLFAKKEPRQN